MSYSAWSPEITLRTAAALGTSAIATVGLDLAAEQFDRAALAVRIVFSPTVAADTTVSFYGGLDPDVISTVALGSLTYTKASSATVIQSTVISGHPYVRVVVNNGDATSAINAQVIALAHYEHHQRRSY